MTIHKKFIDKIILRRDASLSELIGEEGLNLKSQVKDVGDLIDPLDQIFYTIEFLEKEGLIECEKRGYSVNDSLFGLPFDDDPQKIYQVMYLHDLWKTAAGWRIKMRPGLIHFKQQDYQTETQLEKEKSTIGILNEGDNASVLNCEFGTDIGIKNKGQNLLAIGNKFPAKESSEMDNLKSNFSNSHINIKDSQVHFGKGENIKEKSSSVLNNKETFWVKFFWQFIIVIIAGLAVAYLVFNFGWNK